MLFSAQKMSRGLLLWGTAMPKHVVVVKPRASRAEEPNVPPIIQALRDLVGIGYDCGLGHEDAVIFALAWLAVWKIDARDPLHSETLSGDLSSSLLKRDCWQTAIARGLPAESVDLVWARAQQGDSENNPLANALARVVALRIEVPDTEWSLPDAILEIAKTQGGMDASRGVLLDPGLCDFLFHLLDAPPGTSVWIPFDHTGQLVVRAIRQGLKVFAMGPGWYRTPVVIKLLVLIEKGFLNTEMIVFDQERVKAGFPEKVADFLLACPPLGTKVMPGTGWGKWGQRKISDQKLPPLYTKRAGFGFPDVERSETWTVAAFWHAIRQRSVFLTSPNILFAKGKEERLREALLKPRNMVEAVISLPGRLLHGTSLVAAVMVIDSRRESDTSTLVDATKCIEETKSKMRFSRMLDAEAVLGLLHSQIADSSHVAEVPTQSILQQACNLLPTRYISQRIHASDSQRVPLGDLVEIIRAPVNAKEEDAIEVCEVGIPNLGHWRPIDGPYEKKSRVKNVKLDAFSLRTNDIVLSIKGSVGRVGILGDTALLDKSLVCSQSCIVLRASTQSIRPISLFLYLSSKDFREQLEALKVGAAVSHVSPGALLKEILVPVSALDNIAGQTDIYSELCSIESELDQLQRRMNDLTDRL